MVPEELELSLAADFHGFSWLTADVKEQVREYSYSML